MYKHKLTITRDIYLEAESQEMAVELVERITRSRVIRINSLDLKHRCVACTDPIFDEEAATDEDGHILLCSKCRGDNNA